MLLMSEDEFVPCPRPCRRVSPEEEEEEEEEERKVTLRLLGFDISVPLEDSELPMRA